MKAQMKFQKWMCLVMIIVGVLGLLYSFCYMTGSLAALGRTINQTKPRTSKFIAREGYYDALFYDELQPFNTIMMYCGIVMVLLAVVLYITACHKRRNYYVSNYVATGLCAGGNIVISLVLMIMNAIWRGEFLKVDFTAWQNFNTSSVQLGLATEDTVYYGDSTAWFDVGFAIYLIIIIASVLLILNLVWKIMLMKGEKKLLSNEVLAGGETV